MARTSPNQRVLNKIHKEPCDKQNIYARMNKNALFQARKNLTDGEFSLWVYFSSQAESLSGFSISPSAIEQEFGIKETKYKNAMSGLIEKGYLVEVSSKHYDFYEVPVEGNEDSSEAVFVSKEGVKFVF